MKSPRAAEYIARMNETPARAWRLRCDGGSRGNPGPAAYGFVLHDASGAEVEARGEYLGVATNNVAEYRSLIAGLQAAAAHGVAALEVNMDSELVVRQMTGEYRVKNEGLKPLNLAARHAAARIPQLRWVSVRREDNARADAIVNETLDRAQGIAPRP